MRKEISCQLIKVCPDQKSRAVEKRQKSNIFFLYYIFHIYPPFTRKRVVLLYFGLGVRTRLGVAFFEVYGPPVFHIKAGASR